VATEFTIELDGFYQVIELPCLRRLSPRFVEWATFAGRYRLVALIGEGA